MKLQLKFLMVFLALICISQLGTAQSPQKTNPEVEAFKQKLYQYFSKYKTPDDSRMPVIKPGTTGSDMPTVNLNSLMVDKELGLAFIFSTKKIFDLATDMVYDMKSEMIFDPATNSFFEFEKPEQENQFFYYRELVPLSKTSKVAIIRNN